MSVLFPNDLLLPALLQKLGGETYIDLPPLSVDDLARLLNSCEVPGITKQVTPDGRFLLLTFRKDGI